VFQAERFFQLSGKREGRKGLCLVSDDDQVECEGSGEPRIWQLFVFHPNVGGGCDNLIPCCNQ